MRQLSLWFRCLAVLLALGAVANGADDVTVRPALRWIPLGQAMSEERYSQWVQRLAPEIQAIRDQPRIRPPFGLFIENVRPGGQAEMAGLKTGDVITQVDGIRLPDSSSLNGLRTDAPQDLSVWTAKDGERTVRIKPGMVGVSQSRSWSPVYGYLAAPTPGAPWEADLIMAAVAMEWDASVAERALMLAQDHGCTHPTWFAVAGEVALQLGRLPEAMAFARVALPLVAAHERLPIAHVLYTAALASGQVAIADETARSYGTISYVGERADVLHRLAGSADFYRAALIAHPLMSIADLSSPRPDEPDRGRELVYLSAQQLQVSKILPKLDPEGDLVFKGNERTATLNRDGKLGFASHRARLDLTRVGPIMRDLDMSVTCEVDNDNATFKTSMGAYAIGIAEHHDLDGSILVRLQITEDSKIQVRVEGLPDYDIKRRPFPLYAPHRLQVRIRAHSMAILVDELIVYHGPIMADPATRQLGLDIYTRDLVGTWSRLSWRGVAASQNLPLAPVETDRPKPPPLGANDF